MAKTTEERPRNKELEVYNSLATLTVIEHDITSIMTDIGTKSHLRTSDGPPPDGASSSRTSLISDTATVSSLQDSRLESGYSSNYENENESKLASQGVSSRKDPSDALNVFVTPGKEPNPHYIPEAPASPESSYRRFLKFIVSKNFMRSDRPIPVPTTLPLIQDTRPPRGMTFRVAGSEETANIIKYLRTYP